MDLGLKNKTALVLASSKGIGKAVAARLVTEGARVAICSSSPKNLKKTQAAIKAEHSVVADLSDGAGGRKAAEEAIRHFGHLDILITNNAGPPAKNFMQIEPAEWERTFKSVFLSASEAIRAALPAMIERKWGRVIVFNSVSSIEPSPGLTLSNALRPALNGMVKDLSREVAPHGITINLIQTGYTDTDRLRQPGFDLNKILANLPVGRLGKPEEIAALAAFLASGHAGYITGASIPFDGGRLHSV